MNYEDDGASLPLGSCEVTLRDDERLVEASISTSLCAWPSDLTLKKTRVAAQLLERAGYANRILERRIDQDFVRFSIDVGLGAGANSFGIISLRRFPGSVPSTEISSWQDASTGGQRQAERLQRPGFQGLLKQSDIGGVGTLAGVNVAAS